MATAQPLHNTATVFTHKYYYANNTFLRTPMALIRETIQSMVKQMYVERAFNNTWHKWLIIQVPEDVRFPNLLTTFHEVRYGVSAHLAIISKTRSHPPSAHHLLSFFDTFLTGDFVRTCASRGNFGLFFSNAEVNLDFPLHCQGRLSN